MQKIGGMIAGIFRRQNNDLAKHYGDDHSVLFFAKSLSYILLSCSFTLIIMTGIIFRVGSDLIDQETLPIFFVGNVVPIVAFIGAYYSIRIGKLWIARNIFISITVAAILISILFTGGFFKSTATPFMVVIPVIVFLFYGMRAGTWAAIIVPFVIGAQVFLMYFGGFKFPDFTSHASPMTNQIISHASLYLLLLAMIVSYEFQRRNLRLKLIEESKKLTELANLDPLTNLNNSRHFHRLLNACHRQASEQFSPLTLFFLDLEKFKTINDNFGHQIGDAVLLEVAERIDRATKDSGFCARMGGDEFALIYTIPLSSVAILELENKLRMLISAPITVENQVFNVNVSIGSSQLNKTSCGPVELLHYADEAMYANKRSREANNKNLQIDQPVEQEFLRTA